jgi:hypothetical protein
MVGTTDQLTAAAEALNALGDSYFYAGDYTSARQGGA